MLRDNLSASTTISFDFEYGDDSRVVLSGQSSAVYKRDRFIMELPLLMVYHEKIHPVGL